MYLILGNCSLKDLKEIPCNGVKAAEPEAGTEEA
jgi:hypothetical protein